MINVNRYFLYDLFRQLGCLWEGYGLRENKNLYDLFRN